MGEQMAKLNLGFGPNWKRRPFAIPQLGYVQLKPVSFLLITHGRMTTLRPTAYLSKVKSQSQKSKDYSGHRRPMEVQC